MLWKAKRQNISIWSKAKGFNGLEGTGMRKRWGQVLIEEAWRLAI